MARLIERTVPELEDLKIRGLFNGDEIRSIVKTRTDFEYRINARAPDKMDYLRYIKYEHTLDSLRKKRKQRIAPDGAKSISDFAGEKRIHFIFSRALKKFQGDLTLWDDYIDFAMRGTASSRLSKIFPEALRLHPKAPQLWIKAAVWEYRHNQNIATARMHMQRAIRLNGNDQALWIEYFRLELDYVRKVRARRKILGLNQGGSGGNHNNSSSSSSTTTALSSEHDDSNSEPEQEEQEALSVQTDQEEDVTGEFLKGTIPFIVYSNAVNTVQITSVEFNMQFLDACGSDCPWLSDAILTKCLETLESFESFWDVYARLPEKTSTNGGSGSGSGSGASSSVPSYGDGFELPEDKDTPEEDEDEDEKMKRVRHEVETRYKKAVQRVPTSSMWSKYLEWKMIQTNLEEEQEQEENKQELERQHEATTTSSNKGKRSRNATATIPAASTSTIATNPGANALQLFQEAHRLKCLEPSMYRHWIRYNLLYATTTATATTTTTTTTTTKTSNKKRKISSSSSLSSIEPSTTTSTVIAQYATERHPTSPVAWRIRISVAQQHVTHSSVGLPKLNRLFQTACDTIDSTKEDSWELEAMWIELLCQTTTEWLLHLKTALKRMRRKKYKDRSLLLLANRCYQWMGVEDCRALTVYMISSGEIFSAIVPIEMFQMSVAKEMEACNGDGHACLVPVRSMYELYVTIHSNYIGSWLDYVQYELQFGDMQTVTKVSWRAKKGVGDAQVGLWESEFTKMKLENGN